MTPFAESARKTVAGESWPPHGSLYPGRVCSCHGPDENGERQPDAEFYIFDCLALRSVKKDYPAQG